MKIWREFYISGTDNGWHKVQQVDSKMSTVYGENIRFIWKTNNNERFLPNNN